MKHLSIEDRRTLSTSAAFKHGYCAATESQSKPGSFLYTLKYVFVCFAVAFFLLAGKVHAQAACPHTPSADPPTDRDNVITLYCSTCPHTPSDPPTDKDALIALYCATDGGNWGSSVSSTWKVDMPLDANLSSNNANWRGVVTDADGRVTELYLYSNVYLHGQIPPEIGNLTNLTKLWLHKNRTSRYGGRYLSGQIPPSIGNLTNLQELILYRTNITGPIPSELGTLASLIKLEIYESKLTGWIPPELGNLSSLQELELYQNELTGSIPSELGNLGSLTRLRLDRNNLSGPIPSELGNLGNPDPSDTSSSSALDHLDLSENNLSEPIPPELGNLDGATSISLWNNQLSGPIPPELGNLSSVGTLLIFNNQLTGPLPVALFTMGKLHTLDLRNNRIDGEIPAPPGDFMFLDDSEDPPVMKNQQLSHLYLQNNQLRGPIPTQLKNLKELRWVNLNNNQLMGPIPSELNSTDLIHLSQLRLRGNQLTDPIPAGLANLEPTSLNSLSTDVVIDLSHNQLEGNIPDELWNSTKLKELYLNDNQLTWSTLPTQAQLEGLIRLERLYLQNNMLAGEIPVAGLEALTVDDSDPPEPTNTFRELALWGNEGLELLTAMSDELVKRVDRAVLRVLYEETGGENWTRRRIAVGSYGNHWAWFGTIGYIETDPIFEFWRLPGVTVNGDGRVASLDLNNNNLVGEINNELAQLDGLETLNLSGNRSLLKGTLPVGLMDLPALQTVNIRCTGISTPADADFQAWLAGINFTGGNCPTTTPPPPPQPPTDSSEGTVSVVKDDEGEDVAVAISPKDGGSVSLGNGRTIELTIDRTEAPSQSGDPSIILPLDIIEDISEISFKLYEESQEAPPSGFRLEGLVVEIEIDYELGAGETATVCLPAAGVEEDAEIFHYDEESGMWESLESWLETVNGTPSICAETDSFSFFGVFVAEPDADPVIPGSEQDMDHVGCSVSSDAEAGNTSQRAFFNLLFIMSVLLAASCRKPSRETET